jgi:RHS repeat-associated protein
MNLVGIAGFSTWRRPLRDDDDCDVHDEIDVREESRADRKPDVCGGVTSLDGFDLGAVETPVLDRSDLHVMDDKSRIALMHRWTNDATGAEAGGIVDPANPATYVSKLRYQYGNHLGSASLELDGAGLIISYEEFYPYGETSFMFGSNQVDVKLKEYRYTGKERDDSTSLYYYGQRYYAPWLCRWMSADPAGPVDGLNLYEYARGNPLGFSDPSGTQTDDEVNQTCGPDYYPVKEAGGSTPNEPAAQETEPSPVSAPHRRSKIIQATRGEGGTVQIVPRERGPLPGSPYLSGVASGLAETGRALLKTPMRVLGRKIAEGMVEFKEEILEDPVKAVREAVFLDDESIDAMVEARVSGDLYEAGKVEGPIMVPKAVETVGAAFGAAGGAKVAGKVLGKALDAGTDAVKAGVRKAARAISSRTKTITLFHGSVDDFSTILKKGLDPGRTPTWVTTSSEAAENAISPQRVLSPGQGIDKGVIESIVPESKFRVLQKSGGISPDRQWPGFGRPTQLPENVLRTPEAVELFNRGIIRR